MSGRVADEFETQAVRYLQRTILLEEEHRPLTGAPSPAQLLERVREQLNTVTWAIGIYERECDVAELTQAAVQLMWLGASAATAAVHMDPECADLELTELKDDMLPLIDERVSEAIETECDGDSLSPGELLEPCSAFLAEVDQCIEDDDPSDEELESAAVSLWNVANSATIAVALVERRRVSG